MNRKMLACITLLAALFAAGALVPPASAVEVFGERPSTVDAKSSVRIVFDSYAQALDGKLYLPKACPLKGEHSRVCRIRITGAKPQRLRVSVTLLDDGDFLVRARPA